MSRRHWRARAREGGFTFVELLVTIIIAGIAFAAMVPLFVQAQGQNSADNARNVALQIAQDKVEKIRQLDYDQITPDNLKSTTFAGGQFGDYWDFVRNGNTKRYAIQYTITPVPANAAAGQEKYLNVAVRVTWDAPPSPVKPVILQTIVYRQSAGPKIMTIDVGPADVFNVDPADVKTIIGSPVVIDAYISPEDRAGMDATNANPALRGWVTFTITPFTGTTVASADVNTVYNNELGHYQYVWDNSTAQDGIYKIEVTAVSAKRLPGGTASIPYNVALLIPPAVSGLIASPGDGVVSLMWDQSGIGDLDHYELWRGTASGGETLLTTVPKESASYTDYHVDNDTTYYYKVKVVDIDGNKSSFSSEANATPSHSADTVPPTVPTGLTATKLAGAGTINLVWSASTDLGTPVSGVLGYIIQRGSSATGPWVQLQGAYPNLTYPDSSAGWSKTWYYRIAAVDNALNISAFTPAVGPVTTDPQPKYSLTVSNSNNFSIYVWVQNVGTGQWYATNGTAQGTRPGATTIKKNKSLVWSGLPAGVYNVYASTSTSGSPLLTSKGGSGDLTAGNNSISF